MVSHGIIFTVKKTNKQTGEKKMINKELAKKYGIQKTIEKNLNALNAIELETIYSPSSNELVIAQIEDATYLAKINFLYNDFQYNATIIAAVGNWKDHADDGTVCFNNDEIKAEWENK